MLDYARYRESALQNAYRHDPHFRSVLARQLSPAMREWAEEYLDSMGAQAAGPLAELGASANAHPPILHTHDPWGEPLGEVEVHPDYDRMARLAYEGGVVWPRFNAVAGQPRAPWAVIFGLGYLFGQAEQGLFCPICLTAGSAWILERFASEELKSTYLPRLGARRYEDLWEGAMFLTERTGGSDVGAIETVARADGGVWRLWGDKWFCSNAGRAQVMMVLARPAGAESGTRGLGMFLVPRMLPDGTPNAIRMHRLKDKLGTRSMPTAELTFEGAVGHVIGELGRGFAQMAEMLNISRLYNAVGSVANMRRMLREVIAYTGARTAFGHNIADYPMVRAQIVGLTVEQEADTALAFEAIRLLDLIEAEREKARDPRLLRVLTPLTKYHTARQAVDIASAVAELFGGNGYIEEWPPPRFLRDAQVLPIWEGTSNILILDVLRACAKEQAGSVLLEEVADRLSAAAPPALTGWRNLLLQRRDDLQGYYHALMKLPEDMRALQAKEWCDRAIRLVQAVLLYEEAKRQAGMGEGRGIVALRCFCDRHFGPSDWRERLQQRLTSDAFPVLVEHGRISVEEALNLGVPVETTVGRPV